MTGLVPAIHVFLLRCPKDVDARDEPGHDDSDEVFRHHAGGRVRQKSTTRSAVEGIRRAKFTRAVSMSAGDGIRLGPSRSRISARTVAHSRPSALPIIRIGSYRSPVIRRSSVVIFTVDSADSAAIDCSY